MEKQEFYSLEEVAKILGVTYQLIYRLVRDGELPCFRIGRIYRIRHADLEDYLARSKISGGAFVCSVCGKEYLSRLSAKGACEKCDKPICIDCWSRWGKRFCKEHE